MLLCDLSVLHAVVFEDYCN